jgi:hypothetical protein
MTSTDGKTSDPYCKVGYVFRENATKFEFGSSIQGETKTIKKTLDPTWNETFELWAMAYNEYLDILIEVWDANTVLKDVQMGVATVGWSKITSSINAGKQNMVLDVKPHKPGKKARGTITIDLVATLDVADGESHLSKKLGLVPAGKSSNSSAAPTTSTATSSSASSGASSSASAKILENGKRRKELSTEPHKSLWEAEPSKLEQETQETAKLVAEVMAKFAADEAALEAELAELDIRAQSDSKRLCAFWAAVLPRLSSSAILSLWHTGDTHMRRCISHYVKVLRLTPSARRPIKKWPTSLLSSFRALEELSIRYRDVLSEAKLVISPDHIAGLPPKLRVMDLDANILMKNPTGLPPTLHTWKSNTSFKAEAMKLFPRSITHLEILGAGSDNDFFEALPRGLKTLEIRNPSIFLRRTHEDTAYAHLPRGLTHLLSHYPITERAVFRLPPNLNFLHVVGEYGKCDMFDNTIAAALPGTLTHLSLRNSLRVTDDFIPLLPKGLQYLAIPSCERVSGASFNTLPAGLTHLDVSGLDSIDPSVALKLPSGIKTLNWNFEKAGSGAGVHFSCKGLTTLICSSALKLSGIFIPNIPSTVTDLDMNVSNQLTSAIFGSLPPGLTRLSMLTSRAKISAADAKKLPSTLKSLNISMASVTADTIKALPRGLTELQFGSEDAPPSEAFDELPPNLTRLDSGKTKLLLAALPLLPKSLTDLSVHSYGSGADPKQIVDAMPNLVRMRHDNTLGKPDSVVFWEPTQKL